MLDLTPVPCTHVTLDDAFWSPRVAVNRAATLPREYELYATTGRVAAWELAWTPESGTPAPHIFWDSDIAKWIEAASYALATHPDVALDALLDQVIAKIAAAQPPDGYLNTHFLVLEKHGLGRRWTNLRDEHELYCAGHLIEAAVAHHRATGKRTLLDVLCRYADEIERVFGRAPGKLRGYCGHEEIKLALVKLYHVTAEPRYLRLAQYFVDERGQPPHYFDAEAQARGDDPRAFWARSYEYNQSHRPVREQEVVTGHAVRAMYLYSAMADLAQATGDAALLAACERLWHSVCDERMYLTGGIGPAASNEGFTFAYDLPDERAYAETCAAIGMVFWNQRMLHLTGDGKYADVMERALYNGTISGVSLDGTRFFYENPLASSGAHHRQDWFSVACCPPNLARMLARLGGYFYASGAGGVWVHGYASGSARVTLGAGALTLRQTTDYPWDGTVQIALDMDAPQAFALHLRVPGWCDSWRLHINGAQLNIAPQRGYVRVERAWQAGDTLTLTLTLAVQRIYAHPSVPQMQGRVALQRGPLVYCLEAADNAVTPLDRIALPADAALYAEHRADLLGGVTVLRGAARATEAGDDGGLYRTTPPASAPVEIVAVPYCVWDNRAAGEMRVWLREGGNWRQETGDRRQETGDEGTRLLAAGPFAFFADHAAACSSLVLRALRVLRGSCCRVFVPRSSCASCSSWIILPLLRGVLLGTRAPPR